MVEAQRDPTSLAEEHADPIVAAYTVANEARNASDTRYHDADDTTAESFDDHGHSIPSEGNDTSDVTRDQTIGGAGRRERLRRPPGSIKQARRDKRRAGWAAKKASMRDRKRQERERKEEEMRLAGVEIPAAGENYRNLPQEKWSVSQRIREAKRQEFDALTKAGGYRVCVDMSFHNIMVDTARSSLVQQIMYVYSANRKAKQPCLLTLSGMTSEMMEKVKRLQGFDSWLGVGTDSRCYTECFRREELLYLSAESPNTLNEVEKGKVYIIGGLVDRNAQKGMCYHKATEQGIATARLPLKTEDLRGTHSKVLATNHVFDILVRAMASGGDLHKVEHKQLPPRKRPGWTGGDDRDTSVASGISDACLPATEDLREIQAEDQPDHSETPSMPRVEGTSDSGIDQGKSGVNIASSTEDDEDEEPGNEQGGGHPLCAQAADVARDYGDNGVPDPKRTARGDEVDLNAKRAKPGNRRLQGHELS